MNNLEFIKKYVDSKNPETENIHNELKEEYKLGSALTFKDWYVVSILENKDWLIDNSNQENHYAFFTKQCNNFDAVMAHWYFSDILYRYMPNLKNRTVDLNDSVLIISTDELYNKQDLSLDFLSIGFILSPFLMKEISEKKLIFSCEEHISKLEKYKLEQKLIIKKNSNILHKI